MQCRVESMRMLVRTTWDPLVKASTTSSSNIAREKYFSLTRTRRPVLNTKNQMCTTSNRLQVCGQLQVSIISTCSSLAPITSQCKNGEFSIYPDLLSLVSPRNIVSSASLHLGQRCLISLILELKLDYMTPKEKWKLIGMKLEKYKSKTGAFKERFENAC